MLSHLLIAAALAQQADVTLPEMNVEMYRPPIDAEATMWTDDAGGAPSGHFTTRLYGNYSRGPAALRFDDGSRLDVIRDAMALGLVMGGTVGPFRLGIDLPFYVLATSDFSTKGVGLGDLEVDLKGTVLDPYDHPLGLALSGRFLLPTASMELPLSSPGPAAEVSLIVDRRFDSGLRLAGNVGTFFGPRIEEQNVVQKDALTYRLGAGWVFHEQGGISLDLAGHASFGQPLSKAEATPLEVMVGGWHRLGGALVVRAGVGTALREAIGAAAVRGVVSIGYEPSRMRDRDADGIVDRTDLCRDDPEDVDLFEDSDGCPEPDNDGDGILDAQDGCPLDPEDVDTWRDEDGCPDPLTQLRVWVVDPDGRVVRGVNARLEGIVGNAELAAEVMPGLYRFAAEAEGYDALDAMLNVPQGAPFEVELVMQPAIVLGAVRVEVVDTWDNPLDAVVTIGGDSLSIVGGATEFSMVEGSYELLAEAVDHTPATQSLDVRKGQPTTARVVLVPNHGIVYLKVTGSMGLPVDEAMWIVDGRDPVPVGSGSGESKLAAGTYSAVVMAPNHTSAVLEHVVVDGEDTLHSVTLAPIRVRIVEDQITLDGVVYFDTGRATIKPESFSLLDEVATVLVAHPEILEVRVEGHTDSRGSEEANLDLSGRRASSVLGYLIEASVEPERLTSVGFGESHPVDPAETLEAWEKNRRVDFFIVRRAEAAPPG
ncbi:MAG: OmpA family protein [Deltaproteobacteria bacterium]|nr:OmpA family protein [Deltaproteobacteria bacterium]